MSKIIEIGPEARKKLTEGVDKMADAQQVMAKIAIEKERLRIFKGNQEKQQQVRQAQQNYQAQPGAQQQPQQQEYAPPPQPDAKATEWA